MPRTVEFMFDVGSPTAYLAWAQLPGLVDRTGAEIIYTPILLGGLFRASGNPPPIDTPAKSAYILRDCQRFARRLGVMFKPNPHFPVNTLMIMRAIAGAQRAGQLEPMLTAAFRAMWIGEQKLDDPNTLEALAEQTGIGVSTIAHWIGDETVKAILRKNTDEAARRGAFGAPTFFVGEEMFFGQDRMDWVEEALLAG